MKTKRFLLGIVCLLFSVTASSQQLGDGKVASIDNFDVQHSSGFYRSLNPQSNFPSYWAPEWMLHDKYLINVAMPESDQVHQWQIATSLITDDRIFFRKQYPYFSSIWHELATRGKNIFTDAQYITKTGETGTSPMEEYSPKLFFGSFDDNSDQIFIARYNRADNKSDLRIHIGDDNSGDDSFRIGNMTSHNGSWKSFITVLNNSKVGIGVENPQNALDVNGTIRAKEIIVETGWADFVFAKDYKLPSLNEVKAHIDEHKHLPGIPSEAEVKENGVALSDMTTKMMQKIEELTLYAIQQNETIEKLNKRLDELESNKK